MKEKIEKNVKKIRSRFAPSPTGNLHLGGARTALFAYLFAKTKGGDFLLRIEDTDLERSTKEYEISIIDSLEWLGLKIDEEPLYQSKRFDIYAKYVNQLLEEKKAYRCYCSEGRLTDLRENQIKNNQKTKYDNHCRDKDLPEKEGESFTVRLKSPTSGLTSFIDEIRGEITFENTELDDYVIQRSSKVPTYNFCVVIDDYLSAITHVVRGEDHINNTPKQIHAYEALGWSENIPKFAHLSMIHGDDGSKLSKRHGALNVMEYKQAGYLPAAMINMLVRLGWSYEDQEIFSLAEMEKLFDSGSIHKSKATFDIKKLNWWNSHYIKEKTAESLLNLCKTSIAYQLTKFDENLLISLIDIYKERSQTLVELQNNLLDILVVKDKEHITKALAKYSSEIQALVRVVRDNLLGLEGFTRDEISTLIKKICMENGLKMPDLAKPLRVVLFGEENTPDISNLLATLGKEWVRARFEMVD